MIRVIEKNNIAPMRPVLKVSVIIVMDINVCNDDP